MTKSRTTAATMQREAQKTGHWGRYASPSDLFARYRVCLECGRVTRNPGRTPLLHNGRKPR